MAKQFFLVTTNNHTIFEDKWLFPLYLLMEIISEGGKLTVGTLGKGVVTFIRCGQMYLCIFVKCNFDMSLINVMATKGRDS